jgi:hypothetical protein
MLLIITAYGPANIGSWAPQSQFTVEDELDRTGVVLREAPAMLMASNVKDSAIAVLWLLGEP